MLKRPWTLPLSQSEHQVEDYCPLDLKYGQHHETQQHHLILFAIKM